ncbi:Serine/threonine-protein kinase PknD [compost metagenome]
MRALLLLMLSLALASCKLPSLVPTAPQQAAGVSTSSMGPRLEGRVSARRGVQANVLQDIASHATVSLIDTASGLTLATTVTDQNGSFSLQFGTGFVPVSQRPYFLEAIKGIKGDNPEYNQAGADALRLRTLIFYQANPEGWVSLENAEPGPIYLSMATTTVSLAIAHMQLVVPQFSPHAFIGCLATGTYVADSRPLSEAVYADLYSKVETAILENRDPLHFIAYDSQNGSFPSTYLSFSISGITPSSGAIGTPVVLEGEGFLSGTLDQVAINGLAVTYNPATLTDNRIEFTIPSGARSGNLSVTINGVSQAGPRFTVTMSDGHRSVKHQTLYVANPTWGTVATVKLGGSDMGEIRTLQTGLSSPRQAIVGPDNRVYVSCHDDDTIVRFSLNGDSFETWATGLSGPHGLAFDSAGSLHVSNRSAGTVVKLNASGGIASTFTGFQSPEAIAFDPQGHLLVAEAGGAIRRLLAGSLTPEASTYATVYTPCGLAVDSAGDLYVASNANSVIYRVGYNRLLSVFAMPNRPGGITFDEAGNLFVSDTERNLINRISPNGDSRIVAYGISYPRGLAVDTTTHKAYVALNRANAILEIDGTVLRPFVTGIPNPFTLTFRAGGGSGNGLYIGQPEIGSLSFVSTAASTKGELRTIASGIDEASGADRALDGTIYMGRWGREDSWQPDRNPHQKGGYQTVSPAGAVQPIRYPYGRAGKFRTITGGEEIFELSESLRTLTKITPHANGSRTIQLLHTFGAAPGDVVHDAEGNVYVSVPAEDRVYRFAPPGYAPVAITDFSSPFGLALHDGTLAAVSDDRLYVFNRSSGRMSWVDAPATTNAKTAESAPIVTPAGSTVQGIAAAPGTTDDGVYMAAGTAIVRYDISAQSFASYVTLPASAIQINAFSDGSLHARSTNEALWVVDADKRITQRTLKNYGGAKDWLPSKVLFESDSYDSAIYKMPAPGYGQSRTVYLGALGRNHEVAVDTSVPNQEYLYVASPIAAYAGGLFRYELFGASPKELYVPIAKPYSLAIAADRQVYVGSEDKTIQLVDLSGNVTPKWTLGGLPYGLDLDGSTLWAVGGDNLVYAFPTTQVGNPPAQTFGIMEPVF